MPDHRDAPLCHAVYFTLRDASEEKRKALVASCQEYLDGHPGVRHFSVGELAEDFDRPVNDRRFHVALTLVFENTASHNAYQASARHREFIDRNQENWAEVRVFDSYVA